MYYIDDFRNNSPLTWEQYEAVVRIHGPNGAGLTQTVNLNGNGQEKYFVVGCFTNTGYSSFVHVGRYVDTITNICP